MNTPIRLFSKLLLILLLSFQFTFAMANSGIAQVVEGTAAINYIELNQGDTIKAGDIIKTGANSSVQIIMEDKTALTIGQNTSFEISKYNYNKEKPAESKSHFKLLEGAFRYVSGLIAKNAPENVQTTVGTATIGIRGTTYKISISSTGDVVLWVISGSVTYTSSSGVTTVVNAGSGLSIVSGQPPTTITDVPDFDSTIDDVYEYDDGTWDGAEPPGGGGGGGGGTISPS